MNDRNLIQRISKNPEAFGEVIDAYQDKLMRYIRRTTDISYEDAENILQEVFIKVYRYIHEYDERYSFSSWIYRITHNMVIDNFRKSQKETLNISLEDEEYTHILDSLTDGNSPHHDLRRSDTRICVQKAISMLQNDYREIIVLRYLDKYSYEEISDILKIPLGTASTLVNRAKKQLKEHLKDHHCDS